MAIVGQKKQKLDYETHNFNDDCTLPNLHRPNSKPMCLLCNECVSAVKEYNLKRHFTTKHGDFWVFRTDNYLRLIMEDDL